MQTNQPNQSKSINGIPEQVLIDFVIDQRDQDVARDDIIAQLCIRANVAWQQAESIVQRVEREHPSCKPSWIHFLNLPTIGFAVGIAVIWIIYLLMTRQQLVGKVFLSATGSQSHITRVEAGQSIRLEYDVQVNSGDLFTAVDHSIIDKIMHAQERDLMHPWVWYVIINSSGKGSATIPIPRDDYYQIYLSKNDFAGSYDITWTVDSSE